MASGSTMQDLQKEIAELHKIVKQQSEKIMFNETIMAQLVNHVQYSRTQSNEDEDDDEDDEDEDDEEDEEYDDEEDDDACDKNNCVNSGYESRLDSLEKFVLNLEQKILEMEKRQIK